jgi:hypothetical protein
VTAVSSLTILPPVSFAKHPKCSGTSDSDVRSMDEKMESNVATHDPTNGASTI